MTRQQGFTLLEVLVSMLIVSIGLLGLAGLTTTSLQNNQSAYQRSQATWLAYDMLDRMRANRAVAVTGSYDTAFSTVPSGSTTAAQDLTQWKNTLAAAMPGGQGSIGRANGLVTVTIRWDDSRGLSGNSNQVLSITSQL